MFITVCANRRRPLLANQGVFELITGIWRETSSWLVGRYVIMPDHLHLFCASHGRDAPPLAAWVKYWKTQSSMRWPMTIERPIWQASFWDRQLRSGEHYSTRWDYVRNNPVRHGLVNDPNAWPFQGELNLFRFHDG
jgi:putative transposase